MDSNFQYCSHVHLLSLWHATTDLEEPSSSYVQVQVDLSVRRVHKYIDVSDEVIVDHLASIEINVEVLHFDPHKLMSSYDISYRKLWNMMARFDIMAGFRDHIIKKIIRFGQKIISEDSNIGCKVLHLRGEIEDVRVVFVQDQRSLNGIALTESMVKIDMVPASESLKRVRIDGGDQGQSLHETKRACACESQS